MKEKEWKKVTPSVWASGEWAVVDGGRYADLYKDCQLIQEYPTVAKAMRGANQRTLNQHAAWLEQFRRPKGLEMAKLKERAT